MALGLAIAFVVGPGPLAAQDRPVHLLIDTLALSHLEAIADTATIEHTRCLVGGFRSDTTFALDGIIEAPWLLVSADSNQVRYQYARCPEGTHATWHNHLQHDRAAPPAGYCRMSDADRRLLADDALPALLLISVERRLTCVFFRSEVAPGVYELRRLRWRLGGSRQ